MIEFEEEKNKKLEKLQNKLYSRNSEQIINGDRSEFKKSDYDFSKNVTEKPIFENIESGSFDKVTSKLAHMTEKKHGIISKFFKFSLGFFTIASLIAVFVFWGGNNLVSSRNVDIVVFGPISVPSGQEASFDINIINNNNIDLKEATLLVEYPEGFRYVEDFSKEIVRDKFDIGVIKSKESYRKNIKPVIFGEKESVKEIKVSLEYRVDNSSALFYKEKKYEVSISSAPVVITPVYPKEINSNQEISIDIEVASNSKDRINNFLVNMEYPFGFVFKSAIPAPSFGENIWKFDSLNPSEKKKLTITGTVIGQNNEEKIFKIKSGTVDPNDDRVIGVLFSELNESILLKKPFIGIDLSINNKKTETVAVSSGNNQRVDIFFRNNLPSKLFNVYLEVEIKGPALDIYSVKPDGGGFFESSTNKIIWDKRSVNEFGEMAPGAGQQFSFSFSSLDYKNIPKGQKPEVDIIIKSEGERILESGSVEKVFTSETRKVVLSTDLIFDSRIVRGLGNIENYGPIPPKPNVPTSYTIIWSIRNSFNQVGNTQVKATLPLYVKWKNVFSPQNEKISFNNVTNEVVWDAGTIFSDTGFGSSEKQVAFQVEFLPSISQIGSSPEILGNSTITAIDKITGDKINYFVLPLNTNFYGDPSFRQGDEKVSQ